MTAQVAQHAPSTHRSRTGSIGLAPLANMAFNGADLNPVWQLLVKRVMAEPTDAAALMDLATIKQLTGDRDNGLALQSQALGLQRIYRQQFTDRQRGLRLLALMAPGDFMANTPLEFLLQGRDVTLYQLYVVPGQPLPRQIPEHDLAIVAVGESDHNRAILGEIHRLTRSWPRPVLNPPKRIVALSRDSLAEMLRTVSGIAVPPTVRIDRQVLIRIGSGEVPVADLNGGGGFPIIVRPVASHAGQGLLKLDSVADVKRYLQAQPEPEFYVSPFIDYAGRDGLFRKYRIALIDGRPFACHMAISSHWMVHYLNAGMHESAEKRAEEATFMQSFDADFAPRHRAAFEAMAERIGLEYFAIDCAETGDGRLLLFEADVAMIVHAMDPPTLYPYKPVQMRKVFDAFHALLARKAAS